MKSIRIICLLTVSLALTWKGLGQGFINVDVESTTTNAVVLPDGTGTVPGSTLTPDGNFVNGDPNNVAFNDRALDGAAVILRGTKSPFAAAIQGNYSILLQGGSNFIRFGTNGASIGQIVQNPLTTQSIIYWGSALQAPFNGQMLSFNEMSNAPNHTIGGADVSGYAGLTGQLLFSVPRPFSAPLDNPQFSPAPVPEPSIPSLISIHLLSLCRPN